MWIRHTKLTHGYLMVKKKASFCEIWSVWLTVKYIVTECLKYKWDQGSRHRVEMEECLDSALGLEMMDNMKILQFLKSSNL